MSGFGGQWKRWPRADVERYPLFKAELNEQFARREVLTNLAPPKATGAISYIDKTAIEAECGNLRSALSEHAKGFKAAFITAPSPGIIASGMKNEYYDTDAAYFVALARHFISSIRLSSKTDLFCKLTARSWHLSNIFRSGDVRGKTFSRSLKPPSTLSIQPSMACPRTASECTSAGPIRGTARLGCAAEGYFPDNPKGKSRGFRAPICKSAPRTRIPNF
jgi:hypothetical protein